MNLQKINYQKELEKVLDTLRKEGKVPTLLLHSCCAPCSSYVLEYLSEYFKITVFYYNPNIYPESEYTKRILEQQKLISEMHFKNSVSFLAGSYDKEQFYEMAKGLEEVKEGGERCMKCYEMRLKKTAQKAAEEAAAVSERNTEWSICCQTLKRRMDISVLLNFQQFTGFTDRTIVAANFHIKRENLRLKSKKRKKYSRHQTL